MYDLAIIGGGIAGLAAAKAATDRNLSWVLFERDSRLGGVIQSEVVGHYIVERGPNFFSLNDPLLELIRYAGLEHELVRADSRAPERYIGSGYEDERIIFQRAPLSLSQFFLTPLLSRRGKLRLCSEPFAAPTPTGYETVAEFIARKFGVEFFENILSAVFTGIYGNESAKLNPEFVLQQLYALDRLGKSCLLNLPKILRATRQARGSAPPGIYSFPRGLSELTTATVKRLNPETIHTNCAISTVTKVQGGYKLLTDGAEIEASKIITTEDSQNVVRSFAGMNLKLPEVPYQPMKIVHLSLPATAVASFSRSIGFLNPPRLNSPLLGGLFMSNPFPNRAPIGRTLLTCFLKYATAPETILTLLQNQFGERPELVREYSWERAIPQFRDEQRTVIDTVKNFERNNLGISLVGSWSGGLSLRDRVDHASRAVHDLFQ